MDNASVNKVLKRIIMDIVDRVIILKEGVFFECPGNSKKNVEL